MQFQLLFILGIYYSKKGAESPFTIFFILRMSYLKGNFTTFAFTGVFRISMNISVPTFACAVAT